MSTITLSQHRTIKFRASIIADKARSLLALTRDKDIGTDDLRMMSSEIVSMNNDLQLLHSDAQRAMHQLEVNDPTLHIPRPVGIGSEAEVTEAANV